MQKNRFRILALVWLALLSGFVLFLPHIVVAVTALIAGLGGGETGDAVANDLVLTIKPLGILVLAFAIGWICHQRIVGLGIDRRWSIAVAFWLISSLIFLIAIGNFWGTDFSMGLIYLRPPVMLLFALVFMVFLAFKNVSSNRQADDPARLPWMIAVFAASHGIFLAFYWVSEALAVLPYVGGGISGFSLLISQFLAPFYVIGSLWLPGMVAFLLDLSLFTGALIYILYLESLDMSDLLMSDQDAKTDPASPATLTAKPVSDLVFWPMVAVCVSLVSFVTIQFVTQDRSVASGPVVEYIDADGQPMSADQIRKIENSK